MADLANLNNIFLTSKYIFIFSVGVKESSVEGSMAPHFTSHKGGRRGPQRGYCSEELN